jgi:hypothetical protein
MYPPPLMGSLGRLIRASMGEAGFLKNHAIKTAIQPTEGYPFGDGDVHRIGEDKGKSPYFCNSLSICVTPLK